MNGNFAKLLISAVALKKENEMLKDIIKRGGLENEIGEIKSRDRGQSPGDKNKSW